MKIIKVENCNMCPANRIDHEWDNDVYKHICVCELSDYRKIYIDIEKFPDWCPLRDCENESK